MESKTLFLSEVGRNIRKWRQLKEFKQETLAMEIGITKSALSMIENGKSDPPLSRIHQIASALRIPEHHLLFSDPAAGFHSQR